MSACLLRRLQRIKSVNSDLPSKSLKCWRRSCHQPEVCCRAVLTELGAGECFQLKLLWAGSDGNWCRIGWSYWIKSVPNPRAAPCMKWSHCVYTCATWPWRFGPSLCSWCAMEPSKCRFVPSKRWGSHCCSPPIVYQAVWHRLRFILGFPAIKFSLGTRNRAPEPGSARAQWPHGWREQRWWQRGTEHCSWYAAWWLVF